MARSALHRVVRGANASASRAFTSAYTCAHFQRSVPLGHHFAAYSSSHIWAPAVGLQNHTPRQTKTGRPASSAFTSVKGEQTRSTAWTSAASSPAVRSSMPMPCRSRRDCASFRKRIP